MRHIIPIMSLLIFPPSVGMAQSTGENYVMTETVLNSSGGTMKSVQYYNGLGYPTLSVATTGDYGQTAYSAITYDALGREECKYAPVSTGSSIAYTTPAGISYGDNTPYGRTQYDVLDRPVSVTTPGSAFASSPATIAYAANAANEVIRYGETDYTVNRDGYMYESTSFIEKVKNLLGKGSKQDRVYMEGSNKQIVSLPEGAIILLKNDKDFTKMEINDSQSAETFTDAVMKETDVEWARIKHGNKKSVSNTILNNHDDRNVDSAVPTMELYRAKGETIYQFDHSHPIPKNIIGTNAEGLTRIKVSPEDMRTVSKYKPEVSRVMNKQTNEIEYYNSKRVYRYEKW